MDFVIVPNPLQNTTVLATGCSGFLGRHCAAALVRHRLNVHAVSRTRHGLAADGITWHKLDLQSREATERLIATLRPSHLLHLAWVTAPDRYRDAAENLDWMELSLALVKAFAEQGGRRFVGAGSCAEYESMADRCVEDTTPIRPASLYGQCKAAFWMGTEAYARHYGFSAAWGRVFLPYGPGDESRRLVPSLVTALSGGKSIDVTDGSHVRDFIYASDVADLVVRLLETPQATGAYNVATGHGTTVRQVIEKVAGHFHALELVHFGARPGRRDEPPFLVADMGKVERILGWRAANSIEKGLEQLLPRQERSRRNRLRDEASFHAHRD
jgi:nucleoside-diphosphate-sugar epimerase